MESLRLYSIIDDIFYISSLDIDSTVGYTGCIQSHDGKVTLQVSGSTAERFQADAEQALHVYYNHPNRLHRK